MKKYYALSIFWALLGFFAQASTINAAENSGDETKQNVQSDVILQEQGALTRNSPVLQSDGSYYQLYSFQGTARQTVQIRLESQDFDSYLVLLDENGQPLAENDDMAEGLSNSQISFVLPYTGRYQVIVNSYSPGEQGAYTLTIQGLGRSQGSGSPSPQACPEYSLAGNYAQVRTQDSSPLRVRATPNGRVIGAIPSGWQVIVYETDSTGNWTRIGSHFGEEVDQYQEGFGSAPDFRAGWVSTTYLRSLGYSCDKPANLRTLVQPDLFGQREVSVDEDWVARGDRLAHLARSGD
jgi:Bacterial SH3 domain/Bacterial pre-peptidase C-terminal domain